MKDFFVSYNGADKRWAEWISWTLEEVGYETIIQAWDFRPGANFVLEMQRAAETTQRTIAVLSDNYLNAVFTQPEWAEAFSRDPKGDERKLILVRVATCLPKGLLKPVIYADLVGLDEEHARRELLGVLSTRAKPNVPPSFPGNRPPYPFPGIATSSESVWEDKLEFLRFQESASEAIEHAVDVSAKIRSIEKRLSEQRKGGLATQRLASELDKAYQRRENLIKAQEDVSNVEAEIVRIKRELRLGGQLKSGDQLNEGRYLLLDQIGCGGFATVWRARDKSNNVDVAIKVLHNHIASHEISRERFFRGARIMEALRDHEGIVAVHDAACVDDGYYFFVMEYLRDGNLRDAVLSGHVPPSSSLGIMSQMLKILSVAHSHPKKFVHRDIKPTNVLLVDKGRIKLTDFDLVAASDTTGGTKTGMLGTFGYAAPEQWSKPQAADHRADVYSVAMTGLFVLFGRDLPPMEVIRSPKRFVSRLSCSASIKNAIVRAIEYEPDKRFSCAEDFLVELQGGEAEGNDQADNAEPADGNEASATVRPKQKTRYPVPPLSKRKVEKAFENFDAAFREQPIWRNFTVKGKHRYAIEHKGRLYPIKKIVSLATGIPVGNFTSGGGFNERITAMGFRIVPLRASSSA